MPEPVPRLRGKIVQAIGDDQIKWLRANQNFARIQGFIDQAERYWPVAKFPPLGYGLPFPFGDGGLGDVTMSVNTAIPAFNIREYRNLIVNSGVTLSTMETSISLMILYVSERLQLNGTLDMDGDGGDGATRGADATDYTSAYGASGGGGGSSGGGGAGGDGGSTIAAGGVGHTGSDGDGTAGAAITASDLANMRMRQDIRDLSLISWGGGGGGGGGGSSLGVGGDGGGGILIFANEIIISSTGVITADGIDGQDGVGGGQQAGGAGGGAGGFIYIVSRKITNSGSVAAVAGSGGVALDSPDGGDGGAGGAGTVIQEEIP